MQPLCWHKSKTSGISSYIYSVQFFIKELGPTRRYELTIFCRCKMCNSSDSSKMLQMNGPVHDVNGSSSEEEDDEESVEESELTAVSLDVDFPSTKNCWGSGSDVWSTCCNCLDWFDTWSASWICWRSVLDLNSTSEERSKKDGQSKEPVGMMKCLCGNGCCPPHACCVIGRRPCLVSVTIVLCSHSW